MKRILKKLKALFSLFTFRKPAKKKDNYLEFQDSEHNCGPVALAKVLPDLPAKRIMDGFSDCCDKWPFGGVTNKEFNITLRYLNVLSQFEYIDSDDMQLKDFLAQKNDIFILLVYKHFTVVKYGKIDDGYFYEHHCSPKDEVYCAWKLLAPTSLPSR